MQTVSRQRSSMCHAQPVLLSQREMHKTLPPANTTNHTRVYVLYFQLPDTPMRPLPTGTIVPRLRVSAKEWRQMEKASAYSLANCHRVLGFPRPASTAELSAPAPSDREGPPDDGRYDFKPTPGFGFGTAKGSNGRGRGRPAGKPAGGGNYYGRGESGGGYGAKGFGSGGGRGDASGGGGGGGGYAGKEDEYVGEDEYSGRGRGRGREVQYGAGEEGQRVCMGGVQLEPGHGYRGVPAQLEPGHGYRAVQQGGRTGRGGQGGRRM